MCPESAISSSPFRLRCSVAPLLIRSLRHLRLLACRHLRRHRLRHLQYPEGLCRPTTARYPSELPVLALRETVVFPLTLQPLAITRPLSIESVNRALAGDRLLFLTLQTTEGESRSPIS